MWMPLLFAAALAGPAKNDPNAKAAKLTCECLEAADLASKSKDARDQQMGICILSSVNQVDGLDVDFTDPEAGEKIGTAIGMAMALECPELLVTLSQEEESVPVASSPAIETVAGTFESVERGQFVEVVVRADTGRPVRLVWLGYFQGSELVDGLKKGQKVALDYRPFDCWSPKLGDYATCREITGLRRQ